jgi:hypothetical protein
MWGFGEVFEGIQCILKPALLVVLDCFVPLCDPACAFGLVDVGSLGWMVEIHRFCASRQKSPVDEHQSDWVFRGLGHALADENIGSVEFVGRFDPGGDVHRFPHYGHLKARRVTNIPDKGIALMKADADLERNPIWFGFPFLI